MWSETTHYCLCELPVAIFKAFGFLFIWSFSVLWSFLRDRKKTGNVYIFNDAAFLCYWVPGSPGSILRELNLQRALLSGHMVSPCHRVPRRLVLTFHEQSLLFRWECVGHVWTQCCHRLVQVKIPDHTKGTCPVSSGRLMETRREANVDNTSVFKMCRSFARGAHMTSGSTRGVELKFDVQFYYMRKQRQAVSSLRQIRTRNLIWSQRRPLIGIGWF